MSFDLQIHKHQIDYQGSPVEMTVAQIRYVEHATGHVRHQATGVFADDVAGADGLSTLDATLLAINDCFGWTLPTDDHFIGRTVQVQLFNNGAFVCRAGHIYNGKYYVGGLSHRVNAQGRVEVNPYG